jgi:hypothetical protein
MMPKIDQEKMEKYTKILLSYLKLKFCSMKRSNEDKLLLVEGGTDLRFLNKILNENVVCKDSRSVFLTPLPEDQHFNCKAAIVNSVVKLSSFPNELEKNILNNISVYGMIDMDDDDPNTYTRYKMLFYTDTHDLETLLKKSDPGLFSRIKTFKMTVDEYYKVLFMAYQLAIVRGTLAPCLYHSKTKLQLSVSPLRAGTNDIDFGMFFKDCQIELPNVIKYIANKEQIKVSNSNLNKILAEYMGVKMNAKHFNKKTYIWKSKLGEFSPDNIDNYWNIVNGHDIVALLRYVCPNAGEAYSNSEESRLYRKFETDLIDNYSYDCFSRTNLYKSMNNAEIVRELNNNTI